MTPLPSLRRLADGLLRHREWIWVPLTMAFVAVWLHRTIWWPGPGRPPQWLGRDAIETLWPNLSHLAGALRHGEWPLWNPYDRGGYSFAGDPQAGLYYPLTWLFVAPGALFGSGSGLPGWTVQVLAVLQLAVAGTTLHAYLRTRQLPAPAAALGGVALMTSMPWLAHNASGLTWPLAWAPLVWIASDRMIERAGAPGVWRRAAGLGGALGLAGAAGAPAGFFYLLLACLVYGVWRLGVTLADGAATGGREWLRRELPRQSAGLAIATVVTLALTLVVILPALEAAHDSVSAPGPAQAGRALAPWLPIRSLAGLVAPGWASSLDVYMGLATLALVVVGLVARPRADRGAPLAFAALAGLATLLALGGQTPVLRWLVEHVPVFGWFREPYRYDTLVALALAVLAGYGAAALIDHEAWLRRRALVVLGVTLAALLLVLVLEERRAASYVALGIGGALLAAVARAPERFRAALLAAAIGALVVDVGSYEAALAEGREATVDDLEDRRFVADLGDVTTRWRVYDEFVMEQRPGSRLRLRDFRGNPSGDPLESVRYAQVRQRLLADPNLLGAYNVRWVLHGPHHRLGRTRSRFPQVASYMRPEFFRKLDEQRYELVGAAPLVLWYGAVLRAPHSRALDWVAMQESAPGRRRVAIVEEGEVAAGAQDGIARLSRDDVVRTAPATVAGELVSYQANRVAVSVEAPGEGLLVLNEVVAPGWSVRVDGQAATPVRVNYLLRGVVVPAGAHQVVWSYAPRDYWAWLALWGAGVSFVLAAGVSGLRARRREVTNAAAG